MLILNIDVRLAVQLPLRWIALLLAFFFRR